MKAFRAYNQLFLVNHLFYPRNRPSEMISIALFAKNLDFIGNISPAERTIHILPDPKRKALQMKSMAAF
jgi:hypothetical protein